MARRVGRRFFLCGAGGLVVGVPTLTSLLPRELAAQNSPSPKRFVSLTTQSGMISRAWYPSHTPSGFQLRDDVFSDSGKQDGTTYLHDALPEDLRYGYAPLTVFQTANGISPVLHGALNRFLPKMNLLRGLDFMSTVGHGLGGSAALGNYADSSQAPVRSAIDPIPTIDEVMAYSDRVYPERPFRRALHMASGWRSSGSTTNYGVPGGAVEAIDGYNDPLRIWEDFFQGMMSDPMPREDPNLSLVNALHEDYRRVASHPRLSSSDRALLDRHIGFLADIEAGLQPFRAIDCAGPARPESIRADSRLTDPDQLREGVRLMIELGVMALRCDMTRVLTLQISNAAHDGAGSWQTSLHNSAGVPSDWHHYAHDAFETTGSYRNFVAIYEWVTNEVFGKILTELDDTPDGADGSTLLDNSLVVWGNELGQDHYNVMMPTVTAGSLGGTLHTDRYIDYCKWDGSYANKIDWGVLIPGLPHNRFLVTCMQGMGLRPEDYETSGRPGYGSTEAVGTPWAWPSDAWDLAQIGNPIPGVIRD
ncbi:MAG: DUF1552 domain-containing protein [Myxococcota bacterium]